MKPLLTLALLWLATLAVAGVQLEHKSVKKSPHHTGQTGTATLSYISLQDWLASRQGDDLPKDIYDRGFINDDPKVVQPLYDIANELLAHWPGTIPQVPIFIRSDLEKSVYGAEVLIANEMLIYQGSLANVKSDDELAALIAHELSHVLLGHNRKANYINVALDLFSDYERAKNLKDTLTAMDLVRESDGGFEITLDIPELASDVQRASYYRERAASIYYAYHASTLGRGAEKDADLLATDLLIRAGFSPRGLRHSLDRLGSSYLVEHLVSDLMKDSAKTLVDTATVAISDQIKSLEETGELTQELSFSIEEIQDSTEEDLKERVTDYVKTRLSTSHPVPEGRLKNLSNYLVENYSLFERSRKVSDDRLARFRTVRAAMLDTLDNVSLAKAALMSGELDDAQSYGIASLNGAADADPYKRFTMHRVRLGQENRSGAVTNLKRIKSFDGVPNSKFVMMVDLLVESNDVAFARQAIAQKERFGESLSGLYPARIQMALNAEETEEATQIARACINDPDAIAETKSRCNSYGLIQESVEKTGIFSGLQKATSDLSQALTGEKKEQ